MPGLRLPFRFTVVDLPLHVATRRYVTDYRFVDVVTLRYVDSLRLRFTVHALHVTFPVAVTGRSVAVVLTLLPFTLIYRTVVTVAVPAHVYISRSRFVPLRYTVYDLRFTLRFVVLRCVPRLLRLLFVPVPFVRYCRLRVCSVVTRLLRLHFAALHVPALLWVIYVVVRLLRLHVVTLRLI